MRIKDYAFKFLRKRKYYSPLVMLSHYTPFKFLNIPLCPVKKGSISEFIYSLLLKKLLFNGYLLTFSKKKMFKREMACTYYLTPSFLPWGPDMGFRSWPPLNYMQNLHMSAFHWVGSFTFVKFSNEFTTM